MRIQILLLLMISLSGIARADGHEALRTAEQAYAEAWDATPILVENATFVTEKVAIFGDYKPRPDAKFNSGEPMLVYAEPKGYGFLDQGEAFEFGFVLDLEVATSGGVAIFTKKRFNTLSVSSRAKAREMFMIMTVNLGGLAEGEFLLRFRIHDLAS